MAYTVDIYVAEAETPEVWVQIADDLPAALASFGWAPEAPGTYVFRVELYLDGVLQEPGVAFTDAVTTGRSRALTEEMIAILGAPQRRDRTWLWVEDADHEQRDRSSFLTGYEVSYSLDARVGSASVRIRREHGAGSLAPELDASPLNRKADGSYGPAIALRRRFTIWVAPVAFDVIPDFAADGILIFCGNVDEHDFASSDARFSGRDVGGRLADHHIEEVREYGAPEPGQPMQEVIAEILADNTPDVLLYVPNDIDAEFGLDYLLKNYLLEAMRNWSLLAGADLRYLWDDTSGGFRFTLYQPDRVVTEPAYVFKKEEWFEVTALRLNIVNIRNRAAGYFADDLGKRWYVGIPKPPTDESDSEVHPDGYMLVDPESQQAFGRRYAELGLDETSPIRNLAAFQRFQEAFILDMSWPVAEMEIRTVMFPHAGLNRYYGFEADNLRFSEQRNFACVGYRHVYAKGQGNMDDTWETYLTVRGKPAAANEEYLQRVRQPGTTTPPVGEPPPDPTAQRLVHVLAFNQFSFFPVYWQSPATLTVLWEVVNPNMSFSVSIDRSIDSGPWVEFITLLSPDGEYQNDSIPGYQNRPPNDPHPITHSVQYRVRIVDVGGDTVQQRTTASVPLGPL